jgi:hypothetical protein
MLKTALWESLGLGRHDLVCLKHIKVRIREKLGREMQPDDLMNLDLNDPIKFDIDPGLFLRPA